MNFTHSINFFTVVSYLEKKGVPFCTKKDYGAKIMSITGVSVEKKGKFFSANGKIISGNMAECFLNGQTLAIRF